MTLSEIKYQLYLQCQDFVNQRIETYQKAMDAAQQSANNEEKSSAGDKYETGRAMMQLQKDQYAVQLGQVMKLKQVMDKLQPEKANSRVGLGSLVITNQGSFYMAISAGKLSVDQKDYFAIAPSAPLGVCLNGLERGQEASFNGKKYRVMELA